MPVSFFNLKNHLMNFLKISIIAITSLSILSCSQHKKRITNITDYQNYMTDNSGTTDLQKCDETLNFWQARSEKDGGITEQLMLGGLYAKRFKVSGNIHNLLYSDSLLKSVLENHNNLVSVYHSLAANAITQHQFKSAKTFTEKAIQIGEKKSASMLMLADINLELGDLYGAKRILKDFKNKNSYAWLIREAKVKDHEGNLDSAIVYMEKALARVKGNDDLSSWTKTNLGDFYGHAGRIKESYQCYLDVLAKNPHDKYALKQIAWIAFSHDHDTKAAKEIITYLLNQQGIPDYYLLLAHIAKFEHDEVEASKNTKQFVALTAQAEYGEMYNKYLVNLHTNDLNNGEIALAIAQREIQNRPTPQSYDLLAWSYLNLGENEKALQIAKEHVEQQCFEPDAIYHLGMIFKANNQDEKGNAYLKEALQSEFELGPLVSQTIQKQLNRKG